MMMHKNRTFDLPNFNFTGLLEHLLDTVNSQIQPALEYNPLSNKTFIKTQFFFSKN